MKKVFISAGLFILCLFLLHAESYADCEGDLDRDGMVTQSDLALLVDDFGRPDCGDSAPCVGDIHPIDSPDGDVDGFDLTVLTTDFNRIDCPLPVPLNLFNIGNSIGEGEAADSTISSLNHGTVWSTGYNSGDIVYSLNERFEDVDPAGFYENDASRDATFNRAVSGSVMADFVTQAAEVVAEVGATPSGKVGMLTLLLGNNDVCAPSLADMTDPSLFESQYRSGLDVLAASDATKNAHIHVSGIPAIYWLWNAKRTDFLCPFIWFFVPCQNLLSNPANDCASGGSQLNPDTILPDDGDNCVRRKQFHAQIRDIYNPILRDVLMEYVVNERLPNAYYVDIFDIEFESLHVNNGDCFHPSVEGHELLAEEQWCRSPFGLDDPICGP